MPFIYFYNNLYYIFLLPLRSPYTHLPPTVPPCCPCPWVLFLFRLISPPPKLPPSNYLSSVPSPSMKKEHRWNQRAVKYYRVYSFIFVILFSFNLFLRALPNLMFCDFNLQEMLSPLGTNYLQFFLSLSLSKLEEIHETGKFHHAHSRGGKPVPCMR